MNYAYWSKIDIRDLEFHLTQIKLTAFVEDGRSGYQISLGAGIKFQC
jgi:hypothetical protein